eukprot:1484736-Prymnesium_polylepis.1
MAAFAAAADVWACLRAGKRSATRNQSSLFRGRTLSDCHCLARRRRTLRLEETRMCSRSTPEVMPAEMGAVEEVTSHRREAEGKSI